MTYFPQLDIAAEDMILSVSNTCHRVSPLNALMAKNNPECEPM